ncbi:uncharacterized protein LOC141666242 [Apium graveolens]|uniref:uncharacterized protein LOC141666242 n=1 Tax=Apium graveolens TaxID=4045 RepID=UPI003D791117
MKIPKVHTRKLDDRSKMVIYLGKEPGTKAHRLYDPKTGQLHVSRDVKFEENRGWHWVTNTGGKGETQNSFVVVGAQATQYNQEEMGESSVVTPIVATGTPTGTASSESSQPRKFKFLADIYNETDETKLMDELLYAGVDEPMYKQAENDKASNAAMQAEIDTIEKNKTWILTELSEGRKAIQLKWVYKLKKDTEGNVVKYKDRLVPKGYVQKKGIDFEEVFSPVTRLETVRLLLALPAKQGWEVHQMDVKSAFLNAELLEEVYIVQP